MTVAANIPAVVENWIDGKLVPACSGETVPKYSPATGKELCRVARSGREEVEAAIASAKAAQAAWADLTPVARGKILMEVVLGLRARADEMAAVVAAETGKSFKDAKGETGGGIAQGEFWAGEGMRMYGRSLTSGTPDKHCFTVRQPRGVAGLIVPANTPIANVAWKAFPALLCGNTAVMKAAEDTPHTALLFAQIAKDAGLPDGVLNVVQGLGQEAGAPLVESPDVAVISFTGSTGVGRWIAEVCGRRMARCSLELGGKNALVVADDADLDNAVKWVMLSAFSNAGQRCASGSRVIVFDAVYDRFKAALLEATAKLKVGPGDEHDFGPVINQRALDGIIAAVQGAKERGATVLCGGERMTGPGYDGGYYLAPTILEAVSKSDEMAVKEVFGPVTVLFRVSGFAEALELANATPYGLTASIHTLDVNRAVQFAVKVKAGVANVNIGTYGSEPHMPFGGFGDSGNGTREPGTEALDVYSELKNIALTVDRSKL